MWLNRVVSAVNIDVGLEKPDQHVDVPGAVVITIDGSDKGGITFCNVGLRRRWSAVGQSQFGVHPVGLAKIKEKDRALRNLPLCVFLRQLGCVPTRLNGRLY